MISGHGHRNRRGRPRGFTLTELLVVITIIILVSAVALPTVIPALTSRQVSEAARILQAAIAGAHDAAIRANAPRGIRLLPDLTLSPGAVNATTGVILPGQILTSSRIVPIEPAPDLTDSSIRGSATYHSVFASWDSTKNGTVPSGSVGLPPIFPFPPYLPATYTRGVYPYPLPVTAGQPPANMVLMIVQAVWADNLPGIQLNPPTNWFWNVRIGDRFRATDSGRYYTVVGPMTIPNPENFVNDGKSDTSPYAAPFPSLIEQYQTPGSPPGTFTQVNPEYLFLVNGLDDDGDGITDPGVDGVDGVLNIDPATNLPVIDHIGDAAPHPGEWIETEQWVGSQALNALRAETGAINPPPTFEWTITRRPVPSPGAREVSLPGGATIDLSSWDSSAERSRLPVNAFNGTVDVLINQAGELVPTTMYSTPSSFSMAGSFFHFWIADRSDVYAPTMNTTGAPQLPVSTDALHLPSPLPSIFLKKDRVLVTLFTRSGQVVTNSIENFDWTDTNRPFDDAQLGIREAK